MNATDQVIIKRYAGSRLYDTQAARYVTLSDVADMLRAQRRVTVIEAGTGRDVTRPLLADIASTRQ